MANQGEIDPYAAPRAPKERSGPVLRVGIMAVLLAGAAAGWSYMQAQPHNEIGAQSAQQEEMTLEQPVQVADAGAAAVPEATPAPAPEAAAPARSTRREAPAPRSEPAPAVQPAPAPVEAIPAPATTVEPIAPAPVQQM